MVFLVFGEKLKKWMGPACRAGGELSGNGRNIDFCLIFDQFMIEILFDFWVKKCLRDGVVG